MNKLSKITLCSLVTLSVLGTNSLAANSMNANSMPKSTSTVQTVKSVSDQDLAKTIKDKLSSGWFTKGYEQVTVTVTNGNVNLGGIVKTMKDKEKVESEVRNIDGVKRVDSQITTQEASGVKMLRNDDRMNSTRNVANSEKVDRFTQDTASTDADRQLNVKIRDKVSSGILWDSYKGISLDTKDGVVVLEGRVKDVKDEQSLINKVQKIEGVKSVVSHLQTKDDVK